VKFDKNIKEAMDVLYEISGDEETVMLADMRDKALRDEQSRLKGAEKEGENKKAISIAKRMLEKGDSIEDVVDRTELSIEEIEELIGK